ncbi:MAG: hypothetical protein ACJ8R9_21295 [Steroidobacteraceae bacterium]
MQDFLIVKAYHALFAQQVGSILPILLRRVDRVRVADEKHEAYLSKKTWPAI